MSFHEVFFNRASLNNKTQFHLFSFLHARFILNAVLCQKMVTTGSRRKKEVEIFFKQKAMKTKERKKIIDIMKNG